ncbi:MAG TPA: hypothetical protein VKA09_09025 [Nitrososphaeraceae archaeon]|nr:hypothetical protein [Nitrososphaeraceae archaeon]
MSHLNSFYLSSSARVSASRNKFLHLNAISGLLLAISIVIGVIPVISLPFSEVSAQLLSGERRNDSNGLPSILSNLGSNRQNLSSVTDTMSEGIEERIDTRLNSIKSKLDEIAAVALPLILASIAGIAIFAFLIVAFILISWYDRFKVSRKNKRDFRNMSEHVLIELKDNMELLRQRSQMKPASRENSDQVNNQSRHIDTAEISVSAIKASIISPHFWDLSSRAQNVTLKLESLIDKYNKVLRRLNASEDYVLLNKIDRQTADKKLSAFVETLEKYAHDINYLSEQLAELIRTQTSKGTHILSRHAETKSINQ